jgi:hypothetical protein
VQKFYLVFEGCWRGFHILACFVTGVSYCMTSWVHTAWRWSRVQYLWQLPVFQGIVDTTPCCHSTKNESLTNLCQQFFSL